MKSLTALITLYVLLDPTPRTTEFEPEDCITLTSVDALKTSSASLPRTLARMHSPVQIFPSSLTATLSETLDRMYDLTRTPYLPLELVLRFLLAPLHTYPRPPVRLGG